MKVDEGKSWGWWEDRVRSWAIGLSSSVLLPQRKEQWEKRLEKYKEMLGTEEGNVESSSNGFDLLGKVGREVMCLDECE